MDDISQDDGIIKCYPLYQRLQILASLGVNRIRNAYENIISNCQFGFRSNRSTTDAIFILQNSINVSSKPLFLCLS